MGGLITNHLPWVTHRSGVIEGSPDTDMEASATAAMWANVIATYPVVELGRIVDGLFRLSKRHNKVLIRFRSNGADADTFTAQVFVLKQSDDAKLVGTIAGVVGLKRATKLIGTANTLYADELVVTNKFFNPMTSDEESAGVDGMASVAFDASGHEFVLVLITASTMAGEGKKIAVDISGW